MMRAMRKSAGLAAVLAVGGFSAAEAHPHVWVTSKSTIVYEGGRVTAIEQSWTFDEFYSAMAIQGLDTNNDGQYSREELAELTKINMEGLKEFDYFTSGRVGEQKLAFSAPSDAYLDYTGGILSLHFRLPLQKPADPRDFTFATFDPAFFIAFEPDKDGGVTLAGAPASCAVELRDSEKAGAAGNSNQSLTGAFAQQFGGAAVISAKWASIQCKNS